MLPTQQTADMNNPEEHVVWALRDMPNIAGVGGITHPWMLKRWSSHLVEAGFVHTGYLARLADENGMIHVDKLPKQSQKWQQPFRGPRHAYNGAGRWVPMDAPDPEPTRIPDPAQFTIQENHALVNRLEEIGVIKPAPIPQHTATELNEGH